MTKFDFKDFLNCFYSITIPVAFKQNIKFPNVDQKNSQNISSNQMSYGKCY